MSGEALLTELLERGGDDLRSVGLVRGDAVSVLYTRRDIDSTAVSATMAAEGRESAAPPSSTGELDACVSVFEHYIECEFPVGENQTLVAHLDRDGIARLPALIEHCTPLAADGLVVRGGSSGGKNRCPECGSVNFDVRSGRPGRPRETTSRYSCLYCGTNFDEPVKAERREDVTDST